MHFLKQQYMDKNTITGFVLIALILIGFSWYSQPSAEELARMQEMARQDSLAQAQQQKQHEEAGGQRTPALSAQAQDSTSLFFEAFNAEGEEVTLQNGCLRVTLNTRGGSIQSASLPGYLNQQKQPVELLANGLSSLHYLLAGKGENIDTRNYTFQALNSTDSTVTMRLGTEQSHLDICYTLVPNSYLLRVALQAKGLDNVLHPATKSVSIDWHSTAAQQEKGFSFEQQYSALTYKVKNEDVEKLSETKEDEEKPDTPLEWVAFKNQFFSCVLIGDDPLEEASLTSSPCKEKSGNLKDYSAQLSNRFDPTGLKPTQLSFYLGPNDFHILKEHDVLAAPGKDLEMENLVYLGWPLFRTINRWCILPLFDFLAGFGMNMGIVLLLLTIIVKAIVYPTTKKSYLSSARMRVLKPQVDALSAKYPKPEDAMKKQTEMMQLYREYGVSPMGGCLPMLIQLPVWIALFNFVPNAIALRGEKFLWADDLSAYDALLSWDTDLWLIGDHLSIFCLLFCATNIINTWISMRQQRDQMSAEQAQQMKLMQYMMYVMPVMFFFMFNNYSSGLCYYYFLSGLTSILIMWYLRKTTDDSKLLAKLEEYRAKHKNDPRKTSGMAARLEALQKQMEEQQRARANKL